MEIKTAERKLFQFVLKVSFLGQGP